MFATTDPAEPELLAVLAIPGGPCDLAVDGGSAYITDSLGALHVIDVALPSSPAEVAPRFRLDTPEASPLPAIGFT